MFLTKVLLASVLFGLGASVIGCGDVDLNDGSTGDGKGPEFVTTMESGRQGSGSASTMTQSTAQPGTVPTVSACKPDGACLGAVGCMGVCDPVAAVITACQRCADGSFTDCTVRACQP